MHFFALEFTFKEVGFDTEIFSILNVLVTRTIFGVIIFSTQLSYAL